MYTCLTRVMETRIFVERGKYSNQIFAADAISVPPGGFQGVFHWEIDFAFWADTSTWANHINGIVQENLLVKIMGLKIFNQKPKLKHMHYTTRIIINPWLATFTASEKRTWGSGNFCKITHFLKVCTYFNTEFSLMRPSMYLCHNKFNFSGKNSSLDYVWR